MKDLSGKIYYGLHFQPGVAEYKDNPKDDGSPLRIYINSETAKNMDITFPGRPVFVRHKDDMTEEDFQDSDGYVVESFFNKSDGNHWAKFIITTEGGENAIQDGWKLSNAYYRKKQAGPGRCNGVDYDVEVMEGEYEHLAMVRDPRYEQSIVLTPDAFKEYNLQKEQELLKLSNEKDKNPIINNKKGEAGMLNFFKKEKVENSAELENTMVMLPRSNKSISITDLVQNADEEEMKKDEPKSANGGDTVKVGEEEMSVNELVEKYENMKKKSKNEDDDKGDKKKSENEDDDKDDKKKSMENEDEDDKKKSENKKSKNSADEVDGIVEPKVDNANFDKINNAADNAPKVQNTIEMSDDKMARGQSRYGSN